MQADKKLLNLIKQAADCTYDSRKPMNVYIGRISGLAPLKADCGELKDIPASVLTVCGGAAGRLTVGAPVVMLKAEGGQRYVILDTVAQKEALN